MKNYQNPYALNPNMYGGQPGITQTIMVPHGPHGPGCTCGQTMSGYNMMGDQDPQDPDFGPMLGN
ncbi:hypothetical protein V7138_09355, partial [Bacillus sp. JJ1533]|uniref:hypothetical protein n=1 Tax=Bacillus sp. JJ1533 TaxID=3122959 RepID=UPI002FFE6D9A